MSEIKIDQFHLCLERWYVSVELYSFTLGLGWWRRSRKLFAWDSIYYDGRGWSFRLGPLFMTRYPY